MFGFVGKLLEIPVAVLEFAGQKYQYDNSGFDDPPWDQAGYDLGWMMYWEVADGSFTDPSSKCSKRKANRETWERANNTTGPWESDWSLIPYSRAGAYPPPHASGYTGCQRCDEHLPSDVWSTVPGGGPRFGKEWPPIVHEH